MKPTAEAPVAVELAYDVVPSIGTEWPSISALESPDCSTLFASSFCECVRLISCPIWACRKIGGSLSFVLTSPRKVSMCRMDCTVERASGLLLSSNVFSKPRVPRLVRFSGLEPLSHFDGAPVVEFWPTSSEEILPR